VQQYPLPEHIMLNVIVARPRLSRQAGHQVCRVPHHRPAAMQPRLQAKILLGGVLHFWVQLNRVCSAGGTLDRKAQ